MSERAYAAILAGGRGTRFWPLSRRRRAKQFLEVTPGATLIQDTVRRIEPLVPAERIVVILAEDQREEAQRQLPGLPPDNFVVEPVGRNTAAAIGLASVVVAERDPEAVMVVLPADHVIGMEDEFRRVLAAAATAASGSRVLVVMGIRPTGADTGFGYILPGALWGDEHGRRFHRVDRFVEKPSEEVARRYVAEGYLWNSGMFVWSVAAIQSALAEHLPELWRALERVAAVRAGPGRDALLREVYPTLGAISIDHGVLEKSREAVVVPCDFRWSDVGTWSALASVWGRDAEGNAVRGKVVTLNTRGCVAAGADRLVALVDLQDLIVVDTPDAVLVCPVSSDQRIRDLVRLLETSSLDRHL